ncbi:hypothetical protein SAMD00019534_014010, partial [Acytostelium subglobosum LB1]|uniref:hypothetical protein n=1 Tax=Acytostelium subglobosum LB1 TaxID=1410327 RepID=UPI000644CB13
SQGGEVHINRNGEYAYATFVNNDQYAKGVLALKQSLDSAQTLYPMIVLVTEQVSQETVSRLQNLGCITEVAPAIQLDSDVSVQVARWLPAFSKFKAWMMTKYTRIIWLDSDMLIIKNIDHLFSFIDMNEPETIYATVDADATSCQWQPHRMKLINSGLVVLSPRKEIYDKLIANIKPVSKLQNGVVNDQDVLNYTLQWKALNYPEYGVQITHCDCVDPRLWDMDNTHFLHFTAGLQALPKPWQYQPDVGLGDSVPDCVETHYKTWLYHYNKALERV